MVRRQLSHVATIPNLLNKKIVSIKFGMVKKLLPSLQSKKINMRQMQSHIATEKRFSPNGDYTTRGACSAIE
jgi:hypothetical protein